MSNCDVKKKIEETNDTHKKNVENLCEYINTNIMLEWYY
jgi:hypothetical protein